MKNCGMSKLYYLLFVLLIAGLTGCGASKTSTGQVGNGALTAKLVWADKATAKSVASLPAGVTKLRLTVTGAGIPVVRNEIDTTGGATSGTVSGIYPGSVSLVVQALNASSAVLFEGSALNVVVTAGNTTDVGVINMTVPTVKSADTNCLGCHELTIDTTGQNLVADFKQSGHYTNLSFTDGSGVGTGCAGCHGPSHNTPDPYAAGRCFDCHADKVALHANTDAAASAAAMYAPTNYAENCNACHQPHNTNVGNAERHAWAQSAHGDVNGVAWTHYEFQQPSRSTCQRCHTATGYKNFIAGGFTNFAPATSVATATDTANETLACDACHSDNKFTVRTAPAFTAPYTINNAAGATIAFPNVGESNICIACHAGLENGVGGIADFTNASFRNPHYLGAAALMYMSAGFTNFTSGSAAIGTSTYAKSLTPDSTTVPGYGITGGVSSTHRKLGTAGIRGDSHNPAVFIAGQFDANGPCVVCHMNANGAPAGERAAHGHTLAIDGNAYNQVCINCHTSENTVPLNAANFLAVFIEPQSEAYQANLRLAVTVLKNNYNIDYDAATYPYFFKGGLAHTSANAVKDWTLTTGNQVFGQKLMGACFNIQLLTKDPAGYAHARSYSRRLLYDSIDFLDDGVMNLSVGTTAVNSGLLDGHGAALFTKGAAAYNAAGGTITTPAAGTSEAMLYTLGWSRSTGAWSTPERP